MAVDIGHEAPDFTLRDREGNDVSLSSFRGKKNVVLLFYPLAFSGVCTTQLTELGAGYDTYADGDAQVVAVSVDSFFCQGAFQDQVGADQALFLADFEPKGAVARTYGVYLDLGWSTRAAFIIDKAGIVQHADVMAVPTDRPDEAAYLASLSTCAV
jgi:mycoredoxin-dependent peroxiredoxin